MKKVFLIFATTFIYTTYANAATPWWEQPTICKIDPTGCYSNMTAGYFIEIGNPDTWDKSSNCWGMKYICPNALTNGATEPITMERADIAQMKNINRDFDTDILSKYDNCFGVRKSSSDGSRASVNGEYVNVWCRGVLATSEREIDETKNGDVIISGAQPTCNTLARDGYVAVIDNQNGCYGKHFNDTEYFIDCGTQQIPDRLIVLNGADYSTNGTASLTHESADKIFETMYNVSNTQREKYIVK